ncbi:3-(methylthio)propionyl-CoA ligase [soil metagenome]
MDGLMMRMPLSTSALLEHAARHHGSTEIVSRRVEGDIHRTDWRAVEQRARRLAHALENQLGIGPGDRVGTLAWNGYRHVEIYYAVSGMGAVCHTVNPRLFPEQIAWIINDAGDVALMFDSCFAELVAKLVPLCPGVRHWVPMTGAADASALTGFDNATAYETLIEGSRDDWRWPEFEENTASSLCYTSGTTGNPKGVLYSHRSTVLHAYAAVMPDAMGLSAKDVAMPVVPMFHVNAWGMPYSAAMVGCKLVLPGPRLDGASIHELMETERVTFSAGVPTVWLGLMQFVEKNGLRFSTFRRTVIGGSACPAAMIRALNALDVEVVHAWGMSELSPLGTLCHLQSQHADLPEAERLAKLQRQGTVICGVDMRITDADGRELPWDGVAFGELWVRGPWVVDAYFGQDDPSRFEIDADGKRWFATGDVASIDAEGYMQITDRSKDVIKSGGEWISSIELENLAIAHPAIAEAAVIGVAHAKWDERPLLVVVKKPGAEVTREALLAFYQGKVAKFWTPDDVMFVDELPHTATGKLSKLKLRAQLKDYRLPAYDCERIEPVV